MMSEGLRSCQGILEKRGLEITDDEWCHVIETLANELRPSWFVLCLAHLGWPATHEDAEDAVQSYFLLSLSAGTRCSYDPYPAEAVLGGALRLNARTPGKQGERIVVTTARARGPVEVVVTWADCPQCVAKAQLRDTKPKCTHRIVTIEVPLRTNDAGKIVSTAGEVKKAIEFSRADDVVTVTLEDAGNEPIHACVTAWLERGGPKRPTGVEWKIFRGMYRTGLKRFCWERGKKIRKEQARTVSLSDWTYPDGADSADDERDFPTLDLSPEGLAVISEIQEPMRECIRRRLDGLQRRYVAALAGCNVHGWPMSSLVGLVPPKGLKTSPKSDEAIERVLRGVRPDVPQLDEKEHRRRYANLRTWRRRARERLRPCLEAMADVKEEGRKVSGVRP